MIIKEIYICIYGLVHDRRIPSVNGLEILQSCTNPSTCFLSRTSLHVLYWIQQTAYKYHFSQNYIIEYSLVGMTNSYVGKIGKKNRSSCKNLHFYNAHFYQDNNQILFFCNLSIYLVVYSLHHNVLPTLQSIPLMTNGPLYPITQDSSCHGQHTMPRNPWSFRTTSSA